MPSAGKELAGLLREYVRHGQLLQLATVSRAGRPHVCSVWYAADDQLNLYFVSRADRQHSQELSALAAVAGAIVAIDLVGYGQQVRGVSFSGNAIECASADVEAARECYVARWPQAGGLSAGALRTGPVRIYQVRPDSYVLFDEANYPASPRQEVSAW